MTKHQKALPPQISNVGFSLQAQEQFATQRGIVFEHYVAMPSPIGLKDRGDYRRPDSLDVMSSNGFIYKKAGEFRGVILGNSKSHKDVEGGIYDNSTARLVLPKYYEESATNKNKEISLLPGDRIYARDIEMRVPNYQRGEYIPTREDVLQFPVKCVTSLMDSNGVEYVEGRHFKLTSSGNLKWIKGRKNPGIETTDANGNPVRMPYHASIQREYVYHNKIKGDSIDSNDNTQDSRTNEEPVERLDVDGFDLQVDVRNFKQP